MRDGRREEAHGEETVIGGGGRGRGGGGVSGNGGMGVGGGEKAEKKSALVRFSFMLKSITQGWKTMQRGSTRRNAGEGCRDAAHECKFRRRSSYVVAACPA